MPFGSVTSDGVSRDSGTVIFASCDSAHSGSKTGFFGGDVVVSPPPKPFSATGLPDGLGTRVVTIERSSRTYSRRTRFTSSAVTVLMATMSSSGELRPSAASASDHSDARSSIELRLNAACATSLRLAASTRSSGTPDLA